ncbi:MAG: HGGxSTG domain-containing protein [Rhodobacteraceae bacterium]|nr:HGGxSTG domain-containing protein [Paracoccaceae bacterium]
MKVRGVFDDGSTPLPYNDRPSCGAKTRQGHRCKNKVVPGRTKCKFHGGLSTGPRTDAGRAKIAMAQKARWSKRRSRES